MKCLAIYGAGGHAKVVLDTALELGLWDEIIFFEDSSISKSDLLGFPVVGGLDDLISNHNISGVVVAIGNNKVRLQINQLLISKGFNVVSLVHPKATISRFARVGKGVVVFAGAIINSCAVIGDAVIVNSNSTVEHDCNIENGVHLSPMSSLAGGVYVGECSWIGLNASVIQQISIGKDVIVGAGSVVLKNVPSGSTAVGVPAKVVKSSGATC